MRAGYSIGSVQDPLRGGIEHQGKWLSQSNLEDIAADFVELLGSEFRV